MKIELAVIKDLIEVKQLVEDTIKTIYPHYYPKGVVEFFLNKHNENSIREDINHKRVYIVKDNHVSVGTVTLVENEINRLFVKPEYQRKGYGRAIMEFSEELLFRSNENIQLHASLPGKSMYIKRGYQQIDYRKKEVLYGDWICVDIMRKNKR